MRRILFACLTLAAFSVACAANNPTSPTKTCYSSVIGAYPATAGHYFCSYGVCTWIEGTPGTSGTTVTNCY